MDIDKDDKSIVEKTVEAVKGLAASRSPAQEVEDAREVGAEC